MIHDRGVVLRARTPMECVDLGFTLLREDAGGYARTYALPALVGLAVALVASWLSPWLGLALVLPLGRFATAGCTLLAGERITGTPHPPGPGAPFRAAGRLVSETLTANALLLAGCLFPPVALWLLARTFFLPEIVLLERPTDGGMRRAEGLAGRGESTAGIGRVVTFSIDAFGLLGGEAAGQFLVGELLQLDAPFGSLVSVDPTVTPYMLVGYLAVQPLVALVRLAFYLDVRTSQEGLDVYFALWQSIVRGR